jgi:hypothetical protein
MQLYGLFFIFIAHTATFSIQYAFSYDMQGIGTIWIIWMDNICILFLLGLLIVERWTITLFMLERWIYYMDNAHTSRSLKCLEIHIICSLNQDDTNLECLLREFQICLFYRI